MFREVGSFPSLKFVTNLRHPYKKDRFQAIFFYWYYNLPSQYLPRFSFTDGAILGAYCIIIGEFYMQVSRFLERHPIDMGGTLMAVLPLQGRVCLVTGASRGIGAAIVRAAADAGASVIINYRSSRHLAESLAGELRDSGCQAGAIQADVSSPSEVEKLFTMIESDWGPVSLLVNNAGVSLRELVTHTSDEQWEQVINTNLRGPFLCCRRALPHMIRSRWGRIVNIASIWGIRGASCESVYAASKGGLILFTKSLAQEVGPSGVSVNALAPGPIETDMLVEELTAQERQDLAADIPLRRLGSPEDVARMAIYLLCEGGDYINGQVIPIDGGWTA